MMLDADSIASLKTRSAVRGLLARELSGLIGGPAQQHLPAELTSLATGSDREVVDSCRLLDRCYDLRRAADFTSPDTAIGRQIRDLFAKALQRMKELPPDPRETVHVQPPAALDSARPARIRRKQ
jgi:hypothetical protein